MRWLAALLLLVLVAAAAVLYLSRRETAPVVTIEQPGRIVGQTATLTVVAESPGAKLKDLTITVEQNGQTTPLFNFQGAVDNGNATGAASGTLTPNGPNA